MKKIIAITIVSFLLFSIPGNAAQFEKSDIPRPTELPPYKEGELLVKYKDETAIRRAHAAMKASVVKGFKALRLHHVKLPHGISVKDAIKEYQKDPNVDYAEPNYIVRKSKTPNDPYYSQPPNYVQWALPKISASSAWDITTGSGNIIVAVLDTGIDSGHADLAGNMWVNATEKNGTPEVDDDVNGVADDIYGASYKNGVVTGNSMDDDIADSHGTHISGIIGAMGNNGVGVSGVNWAVKLMAVKFLHGSLGEGNISDAVSGITYAVDNGAKIINCSFEIDGYVYSLETALKYADSKGVLIVSAAGNSGRNNDTVSTSPASIRTENNIAVASTTNNDSLSSLSNYGRTTTDVAAPGGASSYDPSGILSTTYRCDDPDYDNLCNNGSIRTRGYDYLAGTSMAAPQVSGLAALVWGNYTGVSHYQVKGRILNGVDKLTGLSTKTISGGRINAYKSLADSELPAIFNATPGKVSADDMITITGVNFGSNAGTVKVGLSSLSVVSWQDTLITATVPEGVSSGELQVNGQGSTFYLSAVTENQSPQVTLSATTLSGHVPLEVSFSALVSDQTGGTVVKYEWDFGDGTFQEYPDITDSAVITFNNPGSYVVKVQVTDNSGLKATASTLVTVFQSGGSSGGGGGCFIATAAYGSPMHPKVEALRQFRDRYLIEDCKLQLGSWKLEIPNILGRGFVNLYYKISPPIARIIANREYLKKAVRVALTPIIRLAEISTTEASGLAEKPPLSLHKPLTSR